MEIKSKMTIKSGVFDYTYFEDINPVENLKGIILQSVHGFCFYKDKFIVVYHNINGHWTVTGGGIEKGETIEEAVTREVHEESNMKVLHQELIGFIDVYDKGKVVRQTRSFCIVEPYGDFVSDPDGDITEIKLIDPKDYKKYFDWGEIGDRIMERAIELNSKYKKNLKSS